jgi:ribose transport system permease protein
VSSVLKEEPEPPPDPAAGGPPRGRAWSRALGAAWSVLNTYGLLIALIVVVAAFSVLRPDIFPTTENAASIVTGSAALALIAIGVMLPLIVQRFDLSPGFMATLAGLLVVGFQSFNHWPVWLAICGAIVVCAFVGLVNGLLIGLAKLNSLIVTLGVGSVLFGASELYTNGATIYKDIPASFLAVGQSRVAGVPLPFVYVMVAGLIIWYVLEYRPIGRFLYAVGGGEEGARLVGIKVDRLVVLVFVASAVMAGLGGVVQSARVGSANASILQTLLLPAFTAAFLGATSIRPGQYNVWGTVLAVYLIGTLTTGVFMLGAPSYFEPVVDGAVLLAAVGLAKLSTRRLSSS